MEQINEITSYTKLIFCITQEREIAIMTQKSKIINIVYNAVFIIMSLILALLFGKISIFPFLKLDFSDIPVFLATLILGASSGITVLLVVSFLRSLMFSSAGWIGFLIRITTIIVIFGLNLFWHKKIKMIYKVLGISFFVVLCLAVKLMLNYYFWINFFGISPSVINGMLVTIILPYNLLKISGMLVVSLLLEKPFKKLINTFN